MLKIFSIPNPLKQKLQIKDATNFTVVKITKLTGVTGGTEGSSTNITHGLTLGKIISADVLVTANNGNKIPPAFISVAEFEFDFFITATTVIVVLSSTNSAQLTGNAITVLITHEV